MWGYQDHKGSIFYILLRSSSDACGNDEIQGRWFATLEEAIEEGKSYSLFNSPLRIEERRVVGRWEDSKKEPKIDKDLDKSQ